jgi:hypothetical protein
MAIEVAEGCRGDIGPKRVQNIVEGDIGLQRGTAVEGLGCRETEDCEEAEGRRET